MRSGDKHPVFENDRDYAPAVEALKPVLHNLPGRIIAIGGLPGVGKTTLGRYLAYRFNVSLIETDLFLLPNRRALVYRENWLKKVIAARLDKADSDWQRPVIIEGATVLRLLASLGRKPDFIIHVINECGFEGRGALADDLRRYEAEYAPAKEAHLCLKLTT